MKRVFQLEVVVLLAGFAGLEWGLFLLGVDPLAGVLVMIASMALLLRSVAGLCGAQSPPGEKSGENETTD